jgi:hypothetical protein
MVEVRTNYSSYVALMNKRTRFVHGGRFIHPLKPSLDEPKRGRIVVTDFSRLPLPTGPIPNSNVTNSGSCSGTDNTKLDSRARVDRRDAKLYEELDLPIQFPQSEVEGEYSHRTTVRERGELRVRSRNLVSANSFPLSQYTGFMLDDHRILAFKVWVIKPLKLGVTLTLWIDRGRWAHQF